MQEIPCGYRFVPTDDELVLEYLLKRVNGEKLPSNAVSDCEIYGDNKEPWKIFNKFTSQKFYFFTKLKKGKGNGMDRKVGCGTWRISRTDTVKDSQNNHVGFKKLFNFVAAKGSATPDNGHWIMHEFSLLDNETDYVVCDIKNKHGINIGEEDEPPQRKRRKCKNLMEDKQTTLSKATTPDDQILSFAAATAASNDIKATPISVLTSDDQFVDTSFLNNISLDKQTTLSQAATPEDQSLGFPATPISVLDDAALCFNNQLVDMSFLDGISLDELLQSF